MGLLNRILFRNARRCFSIWFGSSHPPQAIRRTSNVVVSPEKQQCWATAETVLTGLSAAFDLLDWINFALDLTFCIKLFYLPDSIFYAIVLMIGLILGRIVDFRGSYLLFASDNSNNSSSSNIKTSGSGSGSGGAQGGIRWDPFWISPIYVAASKKYRRVFPLLYCLVFTETAVFLLEDYPSLSIYAHWMVINLPPVPLETFDNVNVAFSTIMLCILLSLFIIAILSSIARLSWHSWNTREKCCNGVKICIFVGLWILLMRFIFDVLVRAVDVVIRDMPRLPSNKIMGIQICDPIVNFQDRPEFCDEESFAINVAFAWLAAFYFSLYLFFRPLRLEDLDDDDDYSMDDDIINDSNTPQNSMSMPAIAATKGVAAVTATTISTGQFYAPPIRDESDDDNDTDPEMGTPILSNKKSPSRNNQEPISETELAAIAASATSRSSVVPTVVLYEITAPKGKLGIILDTVDGRGPIVHRVHSESPLKGKVFEGDIIAFINGIDTRPMNATKITNIMIETAENERLLVVERGEKLTFDATNINSPVVMDEKKQQEATANTTTVEYHEDDSSANDGGVYMEMIDDTDPDIMQSPAELASAAAAEIDDPDIQSPTEMAATIVAAATGPTPQQQLLQQSASASGDDDPLPLIVKSLTTTSQQQQQQIQDFIVVVDNNEPGISTIE